MERLAAKGNDTGNGGCQTVYEDIHVGLAVLQGVEYGNAGKYLSAVGVDVNVNERVLLGKICHLGDYPFRRDALITANVPVQHDGDAAVSGRNKIEKFSFGHRHL